MIPRRFEIACIKSLDFHQRKLSRDFLLYVETKTPLELQSHPFIDRREHRSSRTENNTLLKRHTDKLFAIFFFSHIVYRKNSLLWFPREILNTVKDFFIVIHKKGVSRFFIVCRAFTYLHRKIQISNNSILSPTPTHTTTSLDRIKFVQG